MINPLDVAARAAAIPSILWSASTALLGVRRNGHADADTGSRFASFADGFFERIEDRCRTRWEGLFGTDEEQDVAEEHDAA